MSIHYPPALNRAQRLVGRGITDNLLLDKIGKLLFGFKWAGVFAKDHFADVPITNFYQYAIVNTDTSNLGGEHWIPVAFDFQHMYSSDSFGRDVNKLLLPHTKIKKYTNADRDPEQKKQQTNCGARSLAWLSVFDKHGWKEARKI